MTLSKERNGRITASVAGAVLGLQGAFTSRQKVIKDLVSTMIGNEPKNFRSKATDHGHMNEHRAVQLYLDKNQTACLYNAGEHQRFFAIENWLGATPDGLVDTNGLIEVKCPYKERYIEPSENYYAQMQVQMYCTDRDWCDFIVYWVDENDKVHHHVTRVERNTDWLLINLPKLKAAWDEASEIASDIDKATELLATEERDDEEWLQYTTQYKNIVSAIEHYEQELAACKAKILELAGNRPAVGNGVQLIVSERKGSIKYADALKALCPSADLTPWMGKPSTVYTLKIKE